jgi:lipid A ethanolaminephosphotransferase
MSKISDRRWAMPAWLLGVLVALYMLLVLNHTFWHQWVQSFAGSGGIGEQWPFALSVAVRVVCLELVIVALVLWPRAGKPLLALLILVAAASAYYMDNFGAWLNREVIESIFETSRAEASGLLTPLALRWFALAGLLPAALVLCIPVRFAPWRRGLLARLALLLVLAGLMASIAHFGGRTYRYWYRNHRGMYDVYNPYAALSGTFHYLQKDVLARKRPLVPIGTDATLGPAATADGRKRLVVLVVGETSRAQDYSLQGYGRDTNPEMARAGVYYFRDAWSCGTATTVSVPCMFSDMTRAAFRKPVAMARWNLLDVLQHAGVDVFWRDNDEGCKGVCARVPHQDLTRATVAGLCDSHGCLDDVLVDDLPQQLAKLRAPALLVLHIKGSHGPAYFRRYPADWRRFKPGCNTAEVQTCSYQQVVNSYDNTILYVDHTLGRVVDALKALPEGYDSAMFYLSDHGESLGEGGIYLHGADWDTAPEQQKHIPMLLWLSPAWKQGGGLDLACVAAQTSRKVSQDNLFDTMLGLFDVRTSIYRPQLDLFSSCRRTH